MVTTLGDQFWILTRWLGQLLLASMREMAT
jgi:hypothetical protein